MAMLGAHAGSALVPARGSKLPEADARTGRDDATATADVLSPARPSLRYAEAQLGSARRGAGMRNARGKESAAGHAQGPTQPRMWCGTVCFGIDHPGLAP